MSNNSKGFPNPGELNKVDAPLKIETLDLKLSPEIEQEIKNRKKAWEDLFSYARFLTKEEVEANRSKAYKYVI